MIRCFCFASTTSFTWTPNYKLCNVHLSLPVASLLSSGSSHMALESHSCTLQTGILTTQLNAGWLNQNYRRLNRTGGDPDSSITFNPTGIWNQVLDCLTLCEFSNNSRRHLMAVSSSLCISGIVGQRLRVYGITIQQHSPWVVLVSLEP